ncbi:NUDIX hydrolase [Magnetococcales bacterium HHB-1]
MNDLNTSDSEENFLQNYNIKDYDTPLTTVDICIFTIQQDRLHVLLVQRGEHPHKNQWALPGGFIQIKRDHTLEDAAKRKLFEETGVHSPYLEQVETIGNSQRDPRGWSITVVYFALINSQNVILQHGPDTLLAMWHPLALNKKRGLKFPLAFDHNQLLQSAIERVQRKASYTALPVYLMEEAFTFSELQRVFEIVLQRKIEKSAFRRRIQEADVIRAIPGEKRLGSNRPAQLYSKIDHTPMYYFSRDLKGRPLE